MVDSCPRGLRSPFALSQSIGRRRATRFPRSLNGRALSAAVAIAAAISGLGCATRPYQPAPLDTELARRAFEAREPNDPALRELMNANGVATGQWPLRRWSVEHLDWLAIYQNPALSAATAQVLAARAAPAAAAPRLNPSLRVTPELHRDRPDGAKPWGLGLELDVPVMAASRREALTEQAALTIRLAELERAQLSWQIRGQVRDRYLNWVMTHDQLTLARRELALLAELNQLFEKRLSLGYASALDLANLRGRQAAGVHHAAQLEAKMRDALSQLAQTLNLPADRAEALSLHAARPALTRLGHDPNDARQLRERALRNRLEIERGLLNYAQAEAALKLEVARQHPDWSWRPGLRWDPRDAIFAFGAAVALPILNRNDAAIDQAQLRRDAVAAEFSSLQNQLLNELESAASRLRHRHDEQLRAGQWLREVELRRERTARRFEQGAADRVELVLVKLELIAADRAVRAAQADYDQQLLSLERTVGAPITNF